MNIFYFTSDIVMDLLATLISKYLCFLKFSNSWQISILESPCIRTELSRGFVARSRAKKLLRKSPQRFKLSSTQLIVEVKTSPAHSVGIRSKDAPFQGKTLLMDNLCYCLPKIDNQFINQSFSTFTLFLISNLFRFYVASTGLFKQGDDFKTSQM